MSRRINQTQLAQAVEDMVLGWAEHHGCGLYDFWYSGTHKTDIPEEIARILAEEVKNGLGK